MQGGSEKNGDAGEAAGQAEPDDRRRSRGDAAPPGEQRDIDRDRRDHHGSEPGGNVLLGERDAAVAAQQKAGADDQRSAPIRERTMGRTLRARDRIHDEAGEKETRARHEQRRDCFDREQDREIGRTPNDVERRERGEDDESTGPRHATALWHSRALPSRHPEPR